jgi:hypothetical protein
LKKFTSRHDVYAKTADEEFKRLLCENIAENDPIWSGDSFDIDKLFEDEHFFNIIVKISGWFFLFLKLFLKTIFQNQIFTLK